jgi:hypothetical protein
MSDRTRRRRGSTRRSGSLSGSGGLLHAVKRCLRRACGSAQMGSPVCELRVRGPVPPELLEEIGAEDLGEGPPLTILRTEPTDQPGLHSMLQRLRSLGLDLIQVRTAAPKPSDAIRPEPTAPPDGDRSRPRRAGGPVSRGPLLTELRIDVGLCRPCARRLPPLGAPSAPRTPLGERPPPRAGRLLVRAPAAPRRSR